MAEWTNDDGIVRSPAAAVTARHLDDLDDAAVILHDRRIPNSGGAYIDHLVVAPSGVWVVDAMQREGRVERRDVGGFLRTDVRLFVGRRDASRLIGGIRRQVDAVRSAIGPFAAHVPVVPVLCFVGAEWGRRPRPFDVDGVSVTWPMALPEQIGTAGAIGEHVVDEVARSLERALPPR